MSECLRLYLVSMMTVLTVVSEGLGAYEALINDVSMTALWSIESVMALMTCAIALSIQTTMVVITVMSMASFIALVTVMLLVFLTALMTMKSMMVLKRCPWCSP